MNVALRRPSMTRHAFLEWAEHQATRHEFDGVQPVAMVNTTNDHNRIALNIYFALRQRLRGTGCEAFGMDVGVATIGDAVRYPDGLVTCSPTPGKDRLVPGVVVAFEVLSPSSAHLDLTIKPQEYAAVPTIRYYVVVEQSAVGATLFDRSQPGQPWTVAPVRAGDVLQLPALGLSIPLVEFYEGVRLSEPG